MNLVLSLSTLALRKFIDSTCPAGVSESTDAIARFLVERFTDHSQRLTRALQHANARAWTALELALAGEWFWERCRAAVASAEDKAFAQQVRAFLDATPLPEPAHKRDFRRQCLQELRAVRQAGLLTQGRLEAQHLAEQVAGLARFGDPERILDAEWRLVNGMAKDLQQAGYANLAWLLAQRPVHGTSVLVAGARYFFRRAVEGDPQLFRGLAFAQMERLEQQQEHGFGALEIALTQQGRRLEALLADVQAVVVETYSAVLDLKGQIAGQSGQLQQIGEAVQKLLEQHQLQRREVRPGDSLSIRNDPERQLVRQLVARYRALPEQDRRQIPALLNAVGKLELVAGDFNAAGQDFAVVATLVEDNQARSEAHFNGYQACLERRDWSAAIQEFLQAVKFDARRFAAFPVGKYQPLRILGAGGFGVAFLCKHKYMDAQVVVKTLMPEGLGRHPDEVFAEAQALRQLDHPAIIRVADCGYADPANKSRPFLVMDYFPPGMTLEEYVKKHGPLSVDDFLPVARQVAEGLRAAHGKSILHRDVKPANLLVCKGADGWRVKVIDFGLALRQNVVRASMNASTGRRRKTLLGDSIAGTLDYAAPEQIGKREDAVGPHSDIFGWARTCCYALFQTTQPTLRHWRSLPGPLAELLGRSLEEVSSKRPRQFAEVLAALDEVNSAGGGQLPQTERAPQQEFDFQQNPVEPVGQLSRDSKRRRRKSRLPLFLAGGAVLALVIVGIGLAVLPWPRTKAPTVMVDSEKPGSKVPVEAKHAISQSVAMPIETDVRERTPPAKHQPSADTNDSNIVNNTTAGEVHCLSSHQGGVWAVACSPDGMTGLSGGGNYNKDGKVVVVKDYDIRQWHLTTGQLIRILIGHTETVRSLAISKDGRVGVSGSWDGTVRLWSLQTGAQIGRFNGQAGQVSGVAISRNGEKVAASYQGSIVILWDVKKGTEVKRFTGHTGEVWSVAFSPDETLIAGGGGWGSPIQDNTIRLWDLRSGALHTSFNGQGEGVHSMVFAPDGRRVLAGGSGGRAIVWDVPSAAIVHRFDAHAVCCSADGQTALTGNRDAELRLWSTSDWKELQAFHGHTGVIQSVVMSETGHYGVSGSFDGTVRVWRLPKR